MNGRVRFALPHPMPGTPRARTAACQRAWRQRVGRELRDLAVQRKQRAWVGSLGARLQGTPVSPGMAAGTAYVCLTWQPGVERPYLIDRAGAHAELARFDVAVKASVDELEDLKARMATVLPSREAAILDVHLAMVQDGSFAEKCRRRVRDDFVSMEHAVDQQVRELEMLLEGLPTEFMRERSADVRDVGRRLLRHLGGGAGGISERLKSLPPATVVVAEQLLPSDTLELDRNHVVAIVTERDGASSHVAILARSLGIPAVSEVKDATLLLSTGAPLLVDADRGTITVGPTG